MKSALRAFLLLFVLIPLAALAQAIGAELDRHAAAALGSLYASSPAAAGLGARAKAVLVLPDVRRSSFAEGEPAGDGVLFIGGRIAGHYRMGGLQADLEAGAQSYSYALFFMSDAALENLDDDSLDFDITLDPDVVFVYIGAATELPGVGVQPYY